MRLLAASVRCRTHASGAAAEREATERPPTRHPCQNRTMVVTDRPTTVRVLALPESSPAVVYGMYEILQAAGTAWSQLTGERTDVAPLDVRIAGRAAQMRSFLDIPLHSQVHLSDPAL